MTQSGLLINHTVFPLLSFSLARIAVNEEKEDRAEADVRLPLSLNGGLKPKIEKAKQTRRGRTILLLWQECRSCWTAGIQGPVGDDTPDLFVLLLLNLNTVQHQRKSPQTLPL